LREKAFIPKTNPKNSTPKQEKSIFPKTNPPNSTPKQDKQQRIFKMKIKSGEVWTKVKFNIV
jgi:hypothetical protein